MGASIHDGGIIIMLYNIHSTRLTTTNILPDTPDIPSSRLENLISSFGQIRCPSTVLRGLTTERRQLFVTIRPPCSDFCKFGFLKRKTKVVEWSKFGIGWKFSGAPNFQQSVFSYAHVHTLYSSFHMLRGELLLSHVGASINFLVKARFFEFQTQTAVSRCENTCSSCQQCFN